MTSKANNELTRFASHPPDRVCLLRLSAIGDTCNIVPMLRSLQAAWPDTEFTWVIGKTEASLLGDIPDVRFISFDKKAGMKAYKELRHQLKGEAFDILIAMHPSMRANLASRCISASIKLGFDKARAKDFQTLFTSHRINATPGQHMMDTYFEFAETLGVTKRRMKWEIPVNDVDRAFAKETITGKSVIMSPCSTQRARNFRNWKAENYAAVVGHLWDKHQIETILTGGTTTVEQEYGEQIISQCSHKPVNLIGKTTLKQLFAMICEVPAVLCPDSGPAHMATAAGTPVVALYATTNPARAAPYLSKQWVVNKYPEAVRAEFGKEVSDIPFGKRVRNPDAMSLITIDDVTEVLDKLLSG